MQAFFVYLNFNMKLIVIITSGQITSCTKISTAGHIYQCKYYSARYQQTDGPKHYSCDGRSGGTELL